MSDFSLLCSWVIPSAAVQELGAQDNGLDQATELIVVGDQSGPHLLDGQIVRRHQAAAQGIDKQFPTQILEIIVLSFAPQVGAQTRQSLAVDAVGEGSGGVDRASAQVAGAEFANGAEILEDQAN